MDVHADVNTARLSRQANSRVMSALAWKARMTRVADRVERDGRLAGPVLRVCRRPVHAPVRDARPARPPNRRRACRTARSMAGEREQEPARDLGLAGVALDGVAYLAWTSPAGQGQLFPLGVQAGHLRRAAAGRRRLRTAPAGPASHPDAPGRSAGGRPLRPRDALTRAGRRSAVCTKTPAAEWSGWSSLGCVTNMSVGLSARIWAWMSRSRASPEYGRVRGRRIGVRAVVGQREGRAERRLRRPVAWSTSASARGRGSRGTATWSDRDAQHAHRGARLVLAPVGVLDEVRRARRSVPAKSRSNAHSEAVAVGDDDHVARPRRPCAPGASGPPRPAPRRHSGARRPAAAAIGHGGRASAVQSILARRARGCWRRFGTPCSAPVAPTSSGGRASVSSIARFQRRGRDIFSSWFGETRRVFSGHKQASVSRHCKCRAIEITKPLRG